jgi:hypothetical protein
MKGNPLYHSKERLIPDHWDEEEILERGLRNLDDQKA